MELTLASFSHSIYSTLSHSCVLRSLSLLHMHTHVHTYTRTHAEYPYNRFDRSLGFIKGFRELSIAKRSTKRYTCVCVCVHKHIFHQLSCCSVAQLCLTLWSHGLQHSKLPCLSPSLGSYSNSCPLSQ